MWNIKKYYEKEINAVTVEYSANVEKIEEIIMNTENSEDKYFYFINFSAKLLKKYIDLEKELKEEYFEKEIDELARENKNFYLEILPENYDKSYANPEYAVKVFGEKYGQLMSYFYAQIRANISNSFSHKIFSINEVLDNLIKFFEYIKTDKSDYDEMMKIITKKAHENAKSRFVLSHKERRDANFKRFYDIISGNTEDLRYLYKYGLYITENEIKTAKFFNKYPEDKLEILAKSIVSAYIRGFVLSKKDLSKKNAFYFDYFVGSERLCAKMIKYFNEHNLNPVLAPVSSNPNKQYGFDHKFDNALYLNEETAEFFTKAYREACEECKDILAKDAGPYYIESFGEKPFTPKSKEENLSLSKEQTNISRKMNNEFSLIFDEYSPQSESSYCIVAFPSPEIGDKFEEIFEETANFNMLDNDLYDKIQDTIIQTLDKADYVHVKGKNNNKTDIKVKMPKINNPEKETNFCNCTADANVPAGEVFTTPQLKGTNGILHLPETFLDDYKYTELYFEFENGYVKEYSCKNFEDDAANKKFVFENLLFPNDTLPIGEFAIGTNTLAYQVAKKYDILELLPILIIEKMGPHFAIGDSCYTFEEDEYMENPRDKKEIVAKDNEKSILRKTNIDEAYTGCHTDITLPYEDLAFIKAVDYDGNEFEIIRDGRFVLAGTEELNIPLDKMKG